MTIRILKLCLGVGIPVALIALGVFILSPWNDAPAARRYGESTANWAPPLPFDRLVARSDVVVLGHVVGVAGSDIVYPSGYDPKTDDHLPSGISPAVGFAHYRVRVDEYVVGSGPSELVMRQNGDLRLENLGAAEFPNPELGRSMLLFLSLEPIGGQDFWVSGGPFGQMIEEKGVLAYVWRADDESHAPRPVPFFAGMDLDGAKAAIRQQAVALGR